MNPADLRDALDIMMFVALCFLMMGGFPVAFSLAGTALLFAFLGVAAGVMDFSFLQAMPSRIFSTMTNETLVAVPLFVFMGVMLERSRVAENLLESMGRLFGTLPGGLGISVFIVGALLAASTGIVGATVVTMGLISLPTMLRRGYDPSLAAGAIAASGTLGQIIPPSVILVLLGDVIGSAYQDAQLRQGNFAPDSVTVSDLFAGALVPGLMLVGLYILYQIGLAIFRPSTSPAIPASELNHTYAEAIADTLKAVIAPMALIVAVLGSILGGIATPTEAASIGAVGATLLAGFRLADDPASGARLGVWPVYLSAASFIGLVALTSNFDLRVGRDSGTEAEGIAILAAAALTAAGFFGVLIALLRVWRTKVLHAVMDSTAQISAMVFVILIGAALFSLVFRGLGGDDTIREWLESVPGGVFGAMLAVMLVMFVMGFFLDFIEIIFVVVPVVAPVLLMMGVDPVWLGVMIAMNLQTSFLTPPFGFSLFYLRGVAPPEVTTWDIYRGIMPFVFLQLVALCLLWAVPDIATWLPGLMKQ
jgi:tripartite ATP-independent transporter DctM subunit